MHSHTPKGGLLGTLAAHAASVPVRLYQMRGLAFVTARGPLRTVLLTTERLSCNAATQARDVKFFSEAGYAPGPVQPDLGHRECRHAATGE